MIELSLSSSSVSEVSVISSPKGLKPIEQRIRTINNPNGVSISQVVGMSTTSTVGIVTCTLVTPVAGFSTSVFDVGEQIFVEGHMIDKPDFLKEGMICTIIFHAEEEMPLIVEQPQFLEAEVTYTEPGIKGDTATNTMKPATIDTGAEVRVPLFIDTGDKIKVDVQKGVYVERVKS